MRASKNKLLSNPTQLAWSYLPDMVTRSSRKKKNASSSSSIRPRTDIKNTIGNRYISKAEKEKFVQEIIQTLVDSTLERIGSSYETIFHMNRGLVHILELIDSSPEGKISTRELLRTMHSYNMHKHLKEAERLGYVKREMEKMPQGQKGGSMVVNSLTDEGSALLKLSREYIAAVKPPTTTT